MQNNSPKSLPFLELEVIDNDMYHAQQVAREIVLEMQGFDFVEHSMFPMYVKEDRSLHVALVGEVPTFITVAGIGLPGTDVMTLNCKIECRALDNGWHWLEIKFITADEVRALDATLRSNPAFREDYRLPNYDKHLSNKKLVKSTDALKAARRKAQRKARSNQRKAGR